VLGRQTARAGWPLGAMSALLVVVAVASRRPLSGRGGGGAAVLRAPLAVFVLLALIAGMFLVVMLLLTLPTLGRRNPDELAPHLPPIPAWRTLPVIALVLALALGIVFAIGVLHGGRIHPRVTGGARGVPLAPTVPHVSRPSSGFGLSPVPIIAGVGSVLVLVVCAAAALTRGRQRRFPPPIRADRRRAVASAIDESLADLASSADARAAVIRAYLRMEAVLSHADLPRRAFEAPREYLARAAHLLGSDAASAERLTGLFEEARFSSHEIRASMRDDALAALARLRAHVGVDA
jgi:hypothetical protein